MRKIFLFVIGALLMASCATREEVVLFQDINQQEFVDLDSIYTHPKIRVNDILKIDITALNKKALTPYQFYLPQMGARSTGRLADNLFRGYLVTEDGTIHYPGLGDIYVRGLTTQEAQKKIEEKLSNYIEDPTVRLRIKNFKITILGAVKGPMTLRLQEETVTIPQALGMVKSLDIRALREDVLLIRQKPNGERVTHRLDLRKSDWMNKPYFYLKPNDLIYVEPNNPKVSTAGYITNLGTLLSTISILVSLAALIFR